MSFDISNTKSLRINSIPVMRPKVKNTIFADLYTNRMTGRVESDPETGKGIFDEDGQIVMERKENTWEGRFVGKAFNAAMELKLGDIINIIRGRFDKDAVDYVDPKQQAVTNTYEFSYAVIYEFEMADMSSSEMTLEDLEDYRACLGHRQIPRREKGWEKPDRPIGEFNINIFDNNECIWLNRAKEDVTIAEFTRELFLSYINTTLDLVDDKMIIELAEGLKKKIENLTEENWSFLVSEIPLWTAYDESATEPLYFDEDEEEYDGEIDA